MGMSIKSEKLFAVDFAALLPDLPKEYILQIALVGLIALLAIMIQLLFW
jgi:hypothetical protein